jgi:hypothetical protein
MNKIIGMIAIASALSIALLGCSQPQEGDTSTAPVTKPSTTDKAAPTTTTPSATPGTTK